MAASRKRLILLLLASLVVLAAVVFAWHRAASAPPAGSANSTAESARPGRPGRPLTRRSPRPAGTAPSASTSEAVAALVSDSSLSDAEALAALQRLVNDAGRPLAERLEALDHVINLVPANDPAPLRDMAARRVQPHEVRLRILAEALNREPRVQGDLLVLLLENAAGDVRQEVLTELKALIGEDLGDDPAAWRAAVDKLPVSP